MNQPPPIPAPAPIVPKRAHPPTSRLAVAAVILAVIPCCPLISLVGAALGVMALRRIQASKGAMGGGRLAVWAVCIGSAMSLLTTVVFSSLQSFVQDMNRQIMVEQVTTTIHAAMQGDIARVRTQWLTSDQKSMNDESVLVFGQTLLDRYGPLIRFTISSETTVGALLQPQYEVAGVFVFERSELLGNAAFDVRTTTSAPWPQFRLTSLTIEDVALGSLQLPPETRLPIPAPDPAVAP